MFRKSKILRFAAFYKLAARGAADGADKIIRDILRQTDIAADRTFPSCVRRQLMIDGCNRRNVLAALFKFLDGQAVTIAEHLGVQQVADEQGLRTDGDGFRHF